MVEIVKVQYKEEIGLINLAEVTNFNDFLTYIKDTFEELQFEELSEYYIFHAYENNMIIVRDDRTLQAALKVNPEIFYINVAPSLPIPTKEPGPPFKKRRLFNKSEWIDYCTRGGETIKLPPKMIDMIKSTEFAPSPRSDFEILNDKVAGDYITLPRLGQEPKHFAQGFQKANFVITEQMIDLWKELEADSEQSVKRILAGPMGVGKSYLALFLAAKAYSKGWLLLYVADGESLDKATNYLSSIEICKRFLLLNSDILTPEDFNMLLSPYDDNDPNFWIGSANAILCELLMQKSNKTLLVIDEHDALFRTDPPAPSRLPLLNPLMDLSTWGENYLGARVILTGTAHAKFERKYLVDGMQDLLIFVSPMTSATFNKLLDLSSVFQRLRQDVHSITNRVPRELVLLAKYANERNVTFENATADIVYTLFQDFYILRKYKFANDAKTYYEDSQSIRRESDRRSLSAMFMPKSRPPSFNWRFMDLGLVYRIKVKGTIQYYPLCAPAMGALLDLYKMIPLPQDMKLAVAADNLSGEMFEDVLITSLLRCDLPLVLKATNLNGQEVMPVMINFSRYLLLERGHSPSIGSDVLVRFYAGYLGFDFALGYTFFRVSLSNFTKHNKGSADIRKAFNRPNKGDDKRNELELYLDYALGGSHTVNLVNKHFVVTRNSVPIDNFRIVYLCGSGDLDEFPDVVHINFNELKTSLIGLLFM